LSKNLQKFYLHSAKLVIFDAINILICWQLGENDEQNYEAKILNYLSDFGVQKKFAVVGRCNA